MHTLLQTSLAHSRSRRTGQALILAVLVMLFAVLLSTAFLVIVGNNGRQVGTETERAEASRNADKGVAFVVAKLRASSNPDAWDPSTDATLVGPPLMPADPGSSGGVPQSNNANYDLYYSSLDQAMSWANQGYVKYPDPRRSRQAPQFLVSSHLMGTNLNDDTDGGDKRFMLRITVIGLSSKNPNSWSRRVLYKTTNWNGGTFSYSNFVTSFDPDTQKPVVATLKDPLTVPASTVAGTVIPVIVNSSVGQGNERVTYSPRIADAGNTLMISDGINTPLVGVVAPTTTAGTINLRILKSVTTVANFAPNAKVALVGSLFESTVAIDENGSQGAAPAGTTQPLPLVSVNATPYPYPLTTPQPLGNGSQFNNGLSIPERVAFAARPPLVYNSTIIGQNALTSSGPASINTQLAIADATGQNTTVTGTETTPAQNQFFRASFSPTPGPAQISTINSIVAPAIAPRTIKPAPVNFASYRTRAMGSTTAGGYGYGPGVYIDNSDDVEKFNGQALTTSQLQRLWQRKSFPVLSGGNIAYTGTNVSVAAGTNTLFARLCYGRPGVDSYAYPMATGGLEARGIRGWISPWEFLPRGTQIILNGTTMTIIRDALDNDGGVSDSIAWKNANGTKALQKCNRMTVSFVKQSDGTTTATYNVGIANPPVVTQTVNLFNGIIAAEGNLRVSGTWTGDPLTIVSRNNIYIEGNLSAPAGRIALLAKKNVVLNPTQFVARPAGTVDTSVGRTAFMGSASGGVVTVTSGTDAFKLGDKVAVFAPNTKADGWHTISNITGNKLTFAAGGTAVADATDIKVKLACDPPIVLIAKANKVVGTATTDIPANERFVPTIAGGTEEANTQEYTPATLPTGITDAYWAYKFAVGGDTLARNVPFTNPDGTSASVGVAFDQSAEKKNATFAVQGGDDRNAVPPIDDDGNRRLETRTNAYQLLLSPKPGTATAPPPSPNEQTFDLEMLTGSPDDSQSTLSVLQTQINTPPTADTDDKSNRWRLLLPAAVSPAPNGVLDTVPARRFSKVAMTAALGQNPDDEADDKRAKFRVPLTSSVLLFNGDLNPTSPTALNPILTIGSFFDFQNTTLPTTPAALTEDPRFIDAAQAFYGATPIWNIPSGTTYPQVASTPTTGTVIKPIAFTRDGAGDYNDQLPAYYISAMHFQRVDTANASVPATSATTPKTNMNVEVDATIYAEGGSWFVIPVPTPNSNKASSTDAAQQIEWRRPGYSVTINGNIAQMMTPTATVDYDDEPDADGVATGAMKRWTDTLSYQVSDGTTTKWQTIRYNAAPLPAIDTSLTPPIAALPQLPSSSDILYTYSN